jgi:hypothetical protein
MPQDARSGVARSGVTRSGDFDQSFTIIIAGTDRTRKVWSRDSQIDDVQGADPNSFRATSRGFSVTEGQEIKAYNGGVDVGIPYFCGHILEVEPTSKRKSDRVAYRFVATDYTWLLDQGALITGVYGGIGVNTLVRRLLESFAPAGFTAGYLPSSLGDIDRMQFANESLTDAFTRIADRVEGGALWSCDYRKVISMWPTSEEDPHCMGSTETVVDAGAHREPTYRVDVTQVRTRVICEGGGANTTSQVSNGASVIPVEEMGWYRSSGGTFRAGFVIGTYTGVSAASGPGSLTGVSGVTADIPQGEPVVVRVQDDDSAAQTALAALVGGNGVAVRYISDGRLSLDECEKRASAELENYGAQLREFGYAADDAINLVSGRNVAVNVTKPATVNTTLRAQRVTIRKRSKVSGSTIGLERIVQLSPVRVDLANVLERIN